MKKRLLGLNGNNSKCPPYFGLLLELPLQLLDLRGEPLLGSRQLRDEHFPLLHLSSKLPYEGRVTVDLCLFTEMSCMYVLCAS